ncbi:DMT family transporter [Enterococcus rivorum]|uniref:Multidrug resistance protein SMR n=1 Tax=Enterococcus rivorum TaxID=762845 RepID=A0A1E5KZA7_9ENTE|nr:multidrug efflux SMR transporter [Enterococcus rivorum]MBP2099378.1 paired small multidrug resistance pump [Enterococcus rivorum]OEH83242.1 multidrug resistance protein SMR [Enterococcus rivorum]
MSKDWLKLFLGAFFEVLWVIGMKYSETWWEIALTVILIVISFYALIRAGETLPVGTAYAVFVGLGTAGTVVSGILFFGEPFKILKIILILTLLIGVMGLKLLTDKKGAEE